METITSPWLGFLRGVFLANHLASTINLTRTTKRQNTYHQKLAIQKGGLINNNTIKSMIRYHRQNKPGLVALYNIRPGNGADLFLQPRNPHGPSILNCVLGNPSVNFTLHIYLTILISTRQHACQILTNRDIILFSVLT